MERLGDGMVSGSGEVKSRCRGSWYVERLVVGCSSGRWGDQWEVKG